MVRGLVGLLGLLAGCAAAPMEDGSCDLVAFAEVEPAAGVLGSAGADLAFTLDVEAAGVDVWVDGGVTDGWVALDGVGPSWSVPAVRATAEDRTYTLRVRRCGVVHDEHRFSTLAPAQGDAVLAKSYLFDLLDPDLQWTEPAVPPGRILLASLLGDTRGLLLAPLARESDRITLGVTLAETFSGRLRQDACLDPLVLTDVDFAEDPRFTLRADEVVLQTGNPPGTLLDVTLTGAFGAGGVDVRELRMAARMDMRPHSSGLAGDLCGSYGELIDASCAHCPDQEPSEEPMCLLLDATRPVAPVEPDLPFVLAPVQHAGCR
jgi:hypothetical protein